MRVARMLALFVTLAMLAFGQKEGATPEHGEMLGWKWANFALLAIGLGYLLAKNLPPFFRSRTAEIQSGMQEAARMKADAEARLAEIEKKLAGLGADIENLRSQLKADMSAEGERIRQETARLVKRIQDQAEQDIAFLTKAGRQELKGYAASLALDLAEQRLRSRMNPETQHHLVDSFVRDLQNPGNRSMSQQ